MRTETKTDIGTMTVNQVISEFPQTIAVFNQLGIDACCGGAVPVDTAAVRDGVAPDELRAALLLAIGSDDQ